MIYKAIVIWAGIVVLAVANGWLREAVLIPRIGRFPGLVISGLLLSLASWRWRTRRCRVWAPSPRRGSW